MNVRSSECVDDNPPIELSCGFPVSLLSQLPFCQRPTVAALEFLAFVVPMLYVRLGGQLVYKRGTTVIIL